MIQISKSEKTIELEKEIWKTTNKQGVFGCFEVTIGWFGKERVDYITYDTKGIWRCYEIKISKADFYSKAHNTFVGHYNYYVMPKEIYEEVKNEIPAHIGVYVNGNELMKRAKKQPLGIDEQILKDSLIRSLSRENEKFINTCDSDYINRLKRKISQLERQLKDYQNRYINIYYAIFEICEKYKLNYNEVRGIIKDNFKR